MYDVLKDLAKSVQQFLQGTLPSLGPDWWQDCVIGKLSFQQQRIAEERRFSSLADLDLAGLLRVLDQNWFDVNVDRRFSAEARNWLKEAQSIRNRWAHLPPGGLAAEDEFRDLDTVSRLMAILDADSAATEAVRKRRDELLRAMSPSQPVAAVVASPVVSGSIAKGSVVRLKVRPDQTGVVIDIIEGGNEIRYQVFHDGSFSTYYASQIEQVSTTARREAVSPEDFHASLSALQLRHPSTSHLYSLFSSRIQFVPYQFRPVLKLIQSDRPRILIADEVGVGKTIEAGLILKELQARRDIRSVLVICPKPLVAEQKWLKDVEFRPKLTQGFHPKLTRVKGAQYT